MGAVVPGDLEEAYINQHISLARTVSGFNPEYLAWYLAARTGQKQFQDLQRGVTISRLGLDDICSINLPIPPQAEQNQIVSEIEERFSVVSALDSQVTDNLNRSERLRQAILR